MTADKPASGEDELQFDRAEAAGEKPPGSTCALCQKPIAMYYYEAGGQVVCSSCKNKVEASNVSGLAASSFLRATAFGFLGALAGAAVYYGVLAATGYEIGLIAILVGFMVGYAVRRGAGGRGGRRYQLLATSLTYLAIGSTYVPLAMQQLKESDADVADTAVATVDSLAGGSVPVPLATRPQEPGDAQAAGVAAPARDTLADRLGAADGGVPAPTALGLMIGLGALAVLAAAMPILMVVFGLPESLISALIVGFALHQAWRMNGRAKITFTGPFRVGAAPSVGGAAGA